MSYKSYLITYLRALRATLLFLLPLQKLAHLSDNPVFVVNNKLSIQVLIAFTLAFTQLILILSNPQLFSHRFLLQHS
jgi:hypothetical protein